MGKFLGSPYRFDVTKTPMDSPLSRLQFFVKSKETYSERCSAKKAFQSSMQKSLKNLWRNPNFWNVKGNSVQVYQKWTPLQVYFNNQNNNFSWLLNIT